jgi:hypothetical protein
MLGSVIEVVRHEARWAESTGPDEREHLGSGTHRRVEELKDLGEAEITDLSRRLCVRASLSLCGLERTPKRLGA